MPASQKAQNKRWCSGSQKPPDPDSLSTLLARVRRRVNSVRSMTVAAQMRSCPGKLSDRASDQPAPHPSKIIFQAKLQVAATVLGRDLAEGARRWVAVGLSLRRRGHAELRGSVRATPVRVIEPVEGLRSKLKVVALCERERFEQRQVPVLESRTVIQVSRLVRERARGRHGKDRRSIAILDSEPVVRIATAVRESAVASGQRRIAIDLPRLKGRRSDA